MVKRAAELIGLMTLSTLLPACSSGVPAPTTGPQSASYMGLIETSAAPPSTAAYAPTALTAAEVVSALKSSGVPLSHVTVYTAETDPNHKLGRPGGYTSKSAFVDPRVKRSEAQDTSLGSVDLGGGVEVFPDAAGALARGRYIVAAVQSAPMLAGEYDYVAGGVLLRLSTVLTPAQATSYATALTEAVDAPATAVTK